MNSTWNPKFIMGYTDSETVMVDFDQTPLKVVKTWAHRTMKFHTLGGFIILRSSENNYHIVFNRRVTWTENISIVAWIALLSNNPRLLKWFLMQCIKREPTLRVGPKGKKPSPRIVHRYGEQDVQIQAFLQNRQLIKKILQYLHKYS